ncbi:MAG TPA: hypothetical protein VH817_17180 [Thermoleophilaceae bacterium]|jgi:ketosteroid isomerase-like protein
MSRENLELVGRMFERWNAGDIEGWLLEVRDGKLAGGRDFLDQEEALRAGSKRGS